MESEVSSASLAGNRSASNDAVSTADTPQSSPRALNRRQSSANTPSSYNKSSNSLSPRLSRTSSISSSVPPPRPVHDLLLRRGSDANDDDEVQTYASVSPRMKNVKEEENGEVDEEESKPLVGLGGSKAATTSNDVHRLFVAPQPSRESLFDDEESRGKEDIPSTSEATSRTSLSLLMSSKQSPSPHKEAVSDPRPTLTSSSSSNKPAVPPNRTFISRAAPPVLALTASAAGTAASGRLSESKSSVPFQRQAHFTSALHDWRYDALSNRMMLAGEMIQELDPTYSKYEAPEDSDDDSDEESGAQLSDSATKAKRASSWRMNSRMRTVAVGVSLCLNLGTDPPDIERVWPFARTECGVDPTLYGPDGQLEAMREISERAFDQFQYLNSKAHVQVINDPTEQSTKEMCVFLRREYAKNQRVMIHINGHGVPKPTFNGEIWTYNQDYTQYIPLNCYDLVRWVGYPSIFTFDCSGAGHVMTQFAEIQRDNRMRHKQRLAEWKRESKLSKGMITEKPVKRSCIVLLPCGPNENLPSSSDLPADLFTCCLTTPIPTALRWFIVNNRSTMEPLGIVPEMADHIPGKPPLGEAPDRKTMFGELNWIFTAITDAIAWSVLPLSRFKRLFRQDLLVSSLFRNFILADRIFRALGCTPTSMPEFPPTWRHKMWDSWDQAIERCLIQLPALIPPSIMMQHNWRIPQHAGNPVASAYVESRFFSDQLRAFELWLSLPIPTASPPEQLPLVLHIFLSNQYRRTSLELLARFMDLGDWAVLDALRVGFYPYVTSVLTQAQSNEMFRYDLVRIWCRILAVDKTCREENLSCAFFVAQLTDFHPLVITSVPQKPQSDSTQAFPSKSLDTTSILSGSKVTSPHPPSIKRQTSSTFASQQPPLPHPDRPATNTASSTASVLTEHMIRCAMILCMSCAQNNATIKSTCLIEGMDDACLFHLPVSCTNGLFSWKRPVGTHPRLLQWCCIGLSCLWQDHEEARKRARLMKHYRPLELLLSHHRDPSVREAAVVALTALVGSPIEDDTIIEFELDLLMRILSVCNTSEASPLVRQRVVQCTARLLISPIHSANMHVMFLRSDNKNLKDRLTTSLGSKTSKYTSVWLDLSRTLAADPFPAVASSAQILLGYIRQGHTNRIESYQGRVSGQVSSTASVMSTSAHSLDPLLGESASLFSRTLRRDTRPRIEVLDEAVIAGKTKWALMRRCEEIDRVAALLDKTAAQWISTSSSSNSNGRLPGVSVAPSPHQHTRRRGGTVQPTKHLQELPESLIEAVFNVSNKSPTSSRPISRSGSAAANMHRQPSNTSLMNAPTSIRMSSSSAFLNDMSALSSSSVNVQRPMDELLRVELSRGTASTSNASIATPAVGSSASTPHYATTIISFHPTDALLVCGDARDSITIVDFQAASQGVAGSSDEVPSSISLDPSNLSRFSNKNGAGSSLSGLKWIDPCSVEPLLLCASDDGQIRVWRDVHSGANPRAIAAFSAFASSTSGAVVKPSKASSALTSGRHPSSPPLIIEWHQSTSRLFTNCGANSGLVRVWDLSSEIRLADIRLASADSATVVTCLATRQTSDNPRVLAAGCVDGSIRLLDLRASASKEQQVMGFSREHNGWILSMRLDQDYQLVSASAAGDIRVWDVRRPPTLFSSESWFGFNPVKSQNHVSTSVQSMEEMDYCSIHPRLNMVLCASVKHSIVQLVSLTDNGNEICSLKQEKTSTGFFSASRVARVSSVGVHAREVALAVATDDNVLRVFVPGMSAWPWHATKASSAWVPKAVV